MFYDKAVWLIPSSNKRMDCKVYTAAVLPVSQHKLRTRCVDSSMSHIQKQTRKKLYVILILNNTFTFLIFIAVYYTHK